MKINAHPIDVLAILSRVAGLGILASDATFQTSITALAGPYAPKILAIVGLVPLLAADILRIIGSPSTTPSTPVLVPAVQQGAE